MALPKIVIPKAMRDEAEKFARDKVTEALKGLFGIIEHQLERRQSAAFAAEMSLKHERLALLLRAAKFRILAREARIRRHQYLAMRWSATAYARNAVIAGACKVCPPSPGLA